MNPYNFAHLIFDKGVKNGEKTASSTNVGKRGNPSKKN
jgi:hypothetical protein